MTVKELLEQIVVLSYPGHPDGRVDRLRVIERYAREALKKLEESNG